MIYESDESMEILKQGEDTSQKAIDSYSNYDLKEICPVSSFSSGSTTFKRSKSTDEESISTEDDDINNEHLSSKDATENHGTFISNDDEYLEVKEIPKKIAVVPVTMGTGSRENEEEDGLIHSEFTGHDGATSEVFEVFRESAFDTEEVHYDEEYDDCTFETSNLF